MSQRSLTIREPGCGLCELTRCGQLAREQARRLFYLSAQSRSNDKRPTDQVRQNAVLRSFRWTWTALFFYVCCLVLINCGASRNGNSAVKSSCITRRVFPSAAQFHRCPRHRRSSGPFRPHPTNPFPLLLPILLFP